MEKGEKLFPWLRHHDSTVKIVFTKKLFNADQVRNTENDRYLAHNMTDVPPINSSKHSSSVML